MGEKEKVADIENRKQIRILHIFSDKKFAHPQYAYMDDDFENDILFIGKIEDTKHIKYVVEDNKKGIHSAIGYCNTYNLVVLYNLNLSKAIIANRIDKRTPIIWRFFGTELYCRMPDLMFSELTKKYLNKNQLVERCKRLIKILILNFNYRYLCFSEWEYKKAYRRISYFSGLFYEEYRFLCTKYNLPKFLQLPYLRTSGDIAIPEKKGTTLLIGNNRSEYNNHFDIIEKINEDSELKKFFFLNYGNIKTPYYLKLSEVIQKRDDFYGITNFLSFEDFKNFYYNLDALVINGYRQMAAANIKTALQFGVKVYMNKKNLHYYFLLENGFLVYDVDDLKYDIEKKTITLSNEQIIHNQKAIDALSKKYSKEKFISMIKEILRCS